MSPSEWIVLSMVLLVLVLIARPYWRRRISRWANGRGFTLKSFRVLPFWERGAFSSRHQFWFEVTLEDKRGNIHKAHVCFGSFWGLNPTKVEVEWLREGPTIDDLTQEALTKKAARMANQTNAQKDVFKSRW